MDLFICGIIQTTFSGTTSEPLKCFVELGFIQILGILLALGLTGVSITADDHIAPT